MLLVMILWQFGLHGVMGVEQRAGQKKVFPQHYLDEVAGEAVKRGLKNVSKGRLHEWKARCSDDDRPHVVDTRVQCLLKQGHRPPQPDEQ